MTFARLLNIQYRINKVIESLLDRLTRQNQGEFMKMPLNYLCSLFLAVILLSGCASSRDNATEGTEGATVVLADQLTEVQQARIFLDGVDKGLTPRAVRVDRRFGFSEILLRIGKERVRLIEIEQTSSSSNASELIFSFKGTNDGLYTRFYVDELPRKNDKHIYIPFRPDPLLITDREYGIEILIY